MGCQHHMASALHMNISTCKFSQNPASEQQMHNLMLRKLGSWQTLGQLRIIQAVAATFAAASILILAAVMGSGLVLRSSVPMVSTLEWEFCLHS